VGRLFRTDKSIFAEGKCVKVGGGKRSGGPPRGIAGLGNTVTSVSLKKKLSGKTTCAWAVRKLDFRSAPRLCSQGREEDEGKTAQTQKRAGVRSSGASVKPCERREGGRGLKRIRPGGF